MSDRSGSNSGPGLFKNIVFAAKRWLSICLIPVLFREKTIWLGMTYDNDKHQDGAGAQLHRIYSLYALTRLFQLNYIHSPLKKIKYQGLAALENNKEDPDLVARYNQIFTIPSDVAVPEDVQIKEIEYLNFGALWKLRKEAIRSKRFHLIRCLYPEFVQELKPDSYEDVQKVSPFQRKTPVGGPLRIALHVRRGELNVVDSHRMLPNSYYLSIARKIISILESNKRSYVVELYTELPSKKFEVTPQSHGIDNRTDRSIILDPEMDKIQEFDALPHLHKFINFDAIESLKRLATSDILVMSHSSFSFLAAILNTQAVVLYSPFWHRSPNAWIQTTRTGNFSGESFMEKLERLGISEKRKPS